MKRKLAWVAGAIAVVSLALAQGSGTAVLQGFSKALNDAPALSADYSVQVIGGTQSDYRVTLQKPNKARIDSPTQLVIADGATITTYNKSDKSYFKQPQTSEGFGELLKGDEVSIWQSFFQKDALSKVVSAKLKGERVMGGMKLKMVEFSQDSQARIVKTIFLDEKNVVRRLQTDVKDSSGSMTTLLITKGIESEISSANASDFAFSAPEGSKEVSLEEMNANKIYYDLEEAKKVATATKKKILIDFYADW